jgi:large subunit ribosomal protein L17
MRHRQRTLKLGRTRAHRDLMLANLACSLIEHHRIKTTVAKAKALRPFVEKLVTKARRGTIHDRRIVSAHLKENSVRVKKAVAKLFSEIGPINATRPGGYTRIIKLGPRMSDSPPMAFIEFVEFSGTAVTEAAPAPEAKPAKKPAAKKAPAKAKAEPKAEAAEDAPAEEKKPARKPRAKKTEKKEDAE